MTINRLQNKKGIQGRMTVIGQPFPCYINYTKYVCLRFQSEFKINRKVHTNGIDYIKKIHKPNMTTVEKHIHPWTLVLLNEISNGKFHTTSCRSSWLF